MKRILITLGLFLPFFVHAQVIHTITGNGTASYTGDGGLATSATISHPAQIAMDAAGNIYYAETNNNIIRKINTSGIISTVAGTGVAGFFGDGGLATAAQLNKPYGVDVDAAGNLYIADTYNQRMRKVSTTGIITTIAGTGTLGYFGDGGLATAAQFHFPGFFRVDPSGNIFISDNGNMVVRKINTSGIISTFAGTGVGGFSGDGGLATAAKLNLPNGIWIDNFGNVFIGDDGNGSVRKVNTSGIISTIAGTGVTGFSGDGGPATSAQMRSAEGIFVDNSGNVYIPDALNSRIRVVNTAGTINTLCGTAIAGYNGDNIGAHSAELYYPNSVYIDNAGHIYISDASNQRVRELTPISPITGTLTVCVGDTTYLSDSSIGGTWSSSNTSVAQVTSSGRVWGVSAGTSTISYYIDSTTYATAVVTVNAAPNAGVILGSSFVCVGSTITLSDTASGGVWSSSNTGIATVGSSTGVLTGIGSGVDTVKYTVTNSCGTARAIKLVTVYPLPAVITGNHVVCLGLTTNLTDATSGGTWSSSNTAVGTVGTTGIVTGISLGTTTITYKLSSTGCYNTFTVTVDPVPTPITGTLSICIGSTSPLSDGVGGGSWFSSNTAVATVGGSSGVVTGVAAGTAAITYFIGSSSCAQSVVVTVNSSPGAITGTLSMCVGATSNLTDAASGGTWSSSNIGVATIGTTGLVTGIASGTAIITYQTGASCLATAIVTVNTTPSLISGPGKVCVGSTITLSDATGGGIWTSANPGVATVGSSSGVVTGVAVGITTITYSIGACYTTTSIQVSAAPPPITPVPATVCLGGTTALTDASSGGTWSSSASGIASVATTGVVTGVAVGTATISYTVAGCYVTTTVTVNTAPGAISPANPTVCTGSTTTLTDATSGGVWSSSATGIATVAAGVVNGVAAGTATISYSIGTCYATVTVTVFASPAAITPPSPLVCVGSSVSLTDATAGGAWSSSASGIASVTAGGVVTGNTVGTATISYTVGSCSATSVVTVAAAPAPISPSSALICTGSTVTLTDATGGGVWSSGSIAVATVSGGIVTGVGSGITTISYAIGTCYAFATVSVVPTPAAITPASPVVCLGSTISLTDASGGGVWSSSASGTASITAGGVVTGNAVGTATISYTASGCSATSVVSVVPAPAAISPASAVVCLGSTATLTDATSGGVWSSSAPAVATVSGGVVTGVAIGTATISYSIGTCYTTATVTVNPGPSAITPTPVTICLGGTANLTDATSGGVWSSSAAAIASVTAGGVVTGNSIGTATISYTAAGCSATTVVTVNTAPGTISPANPTVCTGSTVTLTDATSGGIWSSGSPAVALVSGTGVVTGITTGTAKISYSIGYCSSSVTITVNAAPAAITPAPVTICLGGNVTLTDATAGGAWSSSAAAIASVTGGGVVTGNGVGTATISYTIAGCSATIVATVNNAPGAILSSSSTVCTGSTITLTDATSGGIWSSASPAIATVSATGVVTGVAAGTATISYSIGTCSSTTVITVNQTPAAITPTPVTVCLGGTTTLTDATAGGAWSSSASGIASVTAGGVVTGNSVGTATIVYTLAGCSASTVATVNTAPGAILPASPAVCTGSTITLTDATSGGAWSSSATGIATISAGGVVTGIAAGTTTISYAIGTCSSTTTVTVNATPSAINPSPVSLCIGNTATLTDATGGGAWSSVAPSIATISAGGMVTAVASGTATILYTVGGCSAATVITVNTTPSGILPASPMVCLGSTITLSDAVSGGAWSSSNTAIATISATGVVTGVATGNATISYSIGTCVITTTITVNPLPTSINPTPASVCVGGTITLTDATPGGAWSSGTPAIASITAGGLVSGITMGTATIAYTNGFGCAATTVVTVTTLGTAGTILGPLTICQGSFDIYIDYTPGGVWSLSSGIGVISAVGVVDALSPGTTNVIYTVTNACGSVSTSETITIVAATAGAGIISGSSSVCIGSSITLSDATAPGGTWSSSNGHANVGSSTGIVTGISSGLDTIIYSLTTVCGTYTTSATVFVDASATPSAISGPSTVCVGATITLSDAEPGGVYSSSNARATVIPGSGVVTGINPGLDTITYTASNGCGLGSTSKIITVTPAASAGTITGPSTVCPASVIHLTDATGGGTWSATNGNATVGSTGHVMGITAGVDTIIYTVISSCGMTSTTKTVTINPLPDAGTILGPDSVCIGSTITLSDLTPGGVWSAGNGNANVTAGGVVTGFTAGTDPISYAITNSCGTTYTSKIITISTLGDPGVITGVSNVCVGSAITLTDTAPGGIWLSSNGTATLIGPGIVSGVSAGIDSIFYVVINACGTNEARKIINVNPAPVVPAIAGPTSQCSGTVIILTDGLAGGDWSSSNTSIASVGLLTGNVTGLASGIATITYNVTNVFGCSAFATSPDTVNLIPSVSPITGADNVCLSATIALTDATSGGAWSSSNAAIATVDALGNVTGTGIGAATISYTVSNACGSTAAVYAITVNPLPVLTAIAGPSSECVGSTVTLTNTTSGGIWNSSDTTIASVDATGKVTGIAPGVVNITYWVSNAFGCSAAVSTSFTVNALPAVAAITGVTNECAGSSSTLGDATAGGAWTSSDITIATVDPVLGTVLGISQGIVTISYTVTNGAGCSASATTPDTVNIMPVTSPITGASAVCQWSTTTLSNAIPWGVWSSADNTIATVNAGTGVVTGVATGSDIIIYTVTNSCGSVADSATITVNPVPIVAPITAAYATVCSGSTVTLSDVTPGGIWININPLIGSLSTTGVVTGITTGTDTIMYALTNSFGCTGEATYVVTVATALPAIAVTPAMATICHGTPVNMHVTTVIPGLTYQWLLNGVVIPGATNSGYIADSAGTYSLIVSNGTCSETLAGTIVSAQPNPVISFALPHTLYTGSFYSYQWYKNGVAISGATSSVYNETSPGLYTVVVTDINGCSDTSSAYTVSGGTTGVGTTPSVTGIRIYPNPATSVLNIDAPVKVNITLLSVDGKSLIELKDATTIDVSILPNGLYLIMIYDENNMLLTTSKFVKTAQ